MQSITSKQQGDVIKLDNKQYRVISNTQQGVKVQAVDYLSQVYDSNPSAAGYTSAYFNPARSSNIGYYLNNTFYNTLSSLTKSFLVNATWNVGNQDGEAGKTVTAYVGVLTYSEWRSVGTYYSGNIPYLLNLEEWLMTPHSGYMSVAWKVSKTDGSVSSSYNESNNTNMKDTQLVRPVLVLRNNLYVTSSGEVVSNQAPTITPSTIPSDAYASKPSFNYTATDADNNAMTVTESIDGIVFNTRAAVASGTSLTFTPTDIAWLHTRIKQTVNITITANDGNGGVTTVNYPITRTTPAIDLALKTPFETDVAARRLLLQLDGNIPADAVVSVQACNNAFDASPTWENATNFVLSGFSYPFTNKVKTAAKWGVSFKVRVERGSSTQQIYIDGIGGAFD